MTQIIIVIIDDNPGYKPKRAEKCKTCGYPLKSYNSMDTSTWREDDFCSARCKRKAKVLCF